MIQVPRKLAYSFTAEGVKTIVQ